MVEIDWTLLLLLVVAALGVLGLVIALQTAGGRKRLADAALRLAESLIARAIAWLEQDIPGGPDVPAVAAAEPTQTRRARIALDALRKADRGQA
jgi:hypothetical protein